MSLKNLKLNIKQDLKAQIQQEEEKGGSKNDPRFLNFFDLKFDEKMTVLFVPDVNGHFWAKYKMHGPGLRLRGAGSVRCLYEYNGEECPACQKGFGLLNMFNDTKDEAYKDEAKRWFAKDSTIVSCIVLDAPMDITATEDGNQVKLFSMPYNIEEHIKECIKDGRITEEQLCTTPFVIKKSVGKGGNKDKPNASYAHSFFLHGKEVTEDELSYLDDMVVEQFDYENGDVVPAAASYEEIEEWLEKAETLDERAQKDKAKGGRQSSSSRSGGAGESKADSIRERAIQSRRDQEEEESDVGDNQNDVTDEPAPEKPVSDARDRLARFRNRG